jgi:hypothetical protein
LVGAGWGVNAWHTISMQKCQPVGRFIFISLPQEVSNATSGFLPAS